jgi:hypothetical protein
MGSHKFGFPGMTKRAMGDLPPTPGKKFAPGGNPILCRVTDIILNENHPEYGGYTSLGLIVADAVSPNSTISQKVFTASPANSNHKQFPLVNEYVYVYKIISPNFPGGKWVYDPQPISPYGGLAPNASPYPSPTLNTNSDSQKLDYTQIENGAYLLPPSEPTEIPLNSIINPSQATFIEKSNIHPLNQFAGDITYEGRFGQSLRFGSTSKTQGLFINNWSTFGENGNPITILRNGQPENSPSEGWIPISEDVNQDLSSIYMTSNQKIPIGLAREEFKSDKWINPPILPSEFISPQIILNSDRIIINSKKDSILFSAQKSIGISCFEEINLTGKNIVVNGLSVYLGSKDKTQPVLKGDDTVSLLKDVLEALKNLTLALEPLQNFPGGNPVPNFPVQLAASTAKNVLDSSIKRLDNLKSNIVKTQ